MGSQTLYNNKRLLISTSPQTPLHPKMERGRGEVGVKNNFLQIIESKKTIPMRKLMEKLIETTTRHDNCIELVDRFFDKEHISHPKDRSQNGIFRIYQYD
jgi:hypothetical protein